MAIEEYRDWISEDGKAFIENTILSPVFPYYLHNRATSYDACPILMHVVLNRPEERDQGPRNNSPEFYPAFDKLFTEFFRYSGIEADEMLRCCVNLTFNNGHKACATHLDHGYPYKHLLIYCNKSEGETVVLEDDETTEIGRIKPEQYKAVVFDGSPHYQIFPKVGHRVIIVYTFR